MIPAQRKIFEIGPTLGPPVDTIDCVAQVIYYIDGSSKEYDLLISWFSYAELLPLLSQWCFVHDLPTCYHIILAGEEESHGPTLV